MKAFNCSEYVFLISLCITNIKAITQVEKAMITNKLISVGSQCIRDNPLTIAEIKSFQKQIHPDGVNPKCFTACVFKKVGMMDDMGMLSMEGARMSAAQIFKGKEKEEQMKNVDEIMKFCTAVNEQTTSDGAKGCDRAKLAYTCLMDNAAKYGFDIAL